MIRAAVLMATIIALIYIADNHPRPVKIVQSDYCVIEYKSAQKHPLTGQWVTGWATGFGLCSEQDKYFEI